MSVDQIGSLCVIGLVTFTFTAALLSHMHEQGMLNKIEAWLAEHFKFYYLIPIVAVIAVVSFYADNVGFDKEEPNSAHYGQMGDFFGGFLNPMLGFISVILLLSTLKTAQAEQRHQSKKTERDEIQGMIDDFKQLLETQQAEKIYNDYRGNLTYSLLEITEQSSASIADKSAKKVIVATLAAGKKILPYQVRSKIKIIESIKAMRSKIASISELYANLIDKDQNHTINKFNFLKLEAFLRSQVDIDLIHDTEYHDYLDKISTKSGVNNEGFYRSIRINTEPKGTDNSKFGTGSIGHASKSPD